jgi:hypothetical protein
LGIKLWGAFFVFPVALYLLIGLFKKKLRIKKAVLLGAGFILLMGFTLVVTNPGLLIPAVLKGWTRAIFGHLSNRTVGYDDPTNSGVYIKDYATWMKAFKENYLQEYYFYLCFAALGVYSFLGKRKWLAHILLAWCLPLTFFLVNFIATKSYWYIMVLLIPLYPAPFLLISLLEEKGNAFVQKWSEKKWLKAAVWLVVLALSISQMTTNIIKILR